MNKAELEVLLRNRVLDRELLNVVSEARVIVDSEIFVLKTRGLDSDGEEFKYVSEVNISAHELEFAFVDLSWTMFDTEGQRLLKEYQDELRAGGITG